MRALSLSVCVAASLGTPALAFGQPASLYGAPPADVSLKDAAGDDEVSLRNGGMLRGTVVSVEPGKEVVILMQGKGAERHIPWAEVSGVQRGKYARQAAAPPTVAVVPADPATPAAPLDAQLGAPRLHIDSTAPNVTLHEVTMTVGVIGAGGSAYGVFSRPVCQTPCDRIVDGRAGQEFFFAGEGITPSPRFRLADKTGSVTTIVEPGSTALRGGGFALVTVGGVGMGMGLVSLLVGGLTSSSDSRDMGKTSSTFLTIGGVALGAGAAMLAGGIVMVVASKTKFSFLQTAASVASGTYHF